MESALLSGAYGLMGVVLVVQRQKHRSCSWPALVLSCFLMALTFLFAPVEGTEYGIAALLGAVLLLALMELAARARASATPK